MNARTALAVPTAVLRSGIIHAVQARRWLLAYVSANVFLFALGVHVWRFREMGLYLFTIAVGAPASFLVEPLSERMAPGIGWSLGSVAHVWSVNSASVLLNVIFASGIFTILRKARKRARQHAA